MIQPPDDSSEAQSASVSPEQYRSLCTILDSVDAAIYVACMETYELLFVNAYCRAHWGEPNGRRCWEVLQSGQSGPCSFCTNDKLVDANGEPTGTYVWEFQNSATGRWFQCRDQTIRWSDGRLVRLEIATDITERKQIEQELQAAKEKAERLARTDELTGLDNRRAFFDRGQQVFRQAHRSGRPVAVIMLDVDRFKGINDGHGHAAGDVLLKALADSVRTLVREADILARLGGEEFALILPETGLEQALAVAERLRLTVEGLTVAWGYEQLRCTCSLGVAAGSGADLNLDGLLAAADQALLEAKRRGRNRVVAAAGGGAAASAADPGYSAA